MKKSSLSALALTFAGLTLALGGCSVNIGTASTTPTTVESDQVAELAEDALEEQVGRRPDIDCGPDDFELENGASRTCTLTDPEDGKNYDADVELSDVAGTQFHVDVQVADVEQG
ncbi:DUF4333 domain-containing protein [Microbacterium sp. P07]|uniref:DUF4333 domain-containing protein n=1 Tax=Microbacterium sp. P07 TaxID=3366952 RepID=UPI003746CC05